MKRIAIIILIICILLCGCQRDGQANEPATNEQQTPSLAETATQETTVTEDKDEIAVAEEVLCAFFAEYAVADYESMKAYSTDNAISQYFHEGDVFGNTTADILDIFTSKQESNTQIVFGVLVAIDPVPTSSFYGQGKTDFYVRLLKTDGQWKVDEFFTES